MENKYNWLTKEILENDYKELENFKLIAEKYKIPRSTVERYCKRFEIKTNPKIHYTCNESIFSEDTEASFYLAGFIAADGCIFKHKKSKTADCLLICLSKKDETHLMNIKDIMSFTGNIKYEVRNFSKLNSKWNDSETCKMAIYSKQIVSDLESRFNIGQRKSLTYEFPKRLINHPLAHHFMRGYADGDGSFFISKECRKTKKFGIKEYSKFVFSLRGTKLFLEDYGLILSKNGNIESRAQPNFNNGIDQLRYSGNVNVSKIASYLYNGASIYLQRKFDIVKELI